MTETAQAPLEPPPPIHAELDQRRLDQARLLHARTRTSCIIVECVVLYLAALVVLNGDLRFAGLWLAGTSTMVGIVYLASKLLAPEGVTAENYKRYLTVHTAISGLTGLVWGGLAIAYLDADDLFNLFIAINMVFSITVGGMMPSAEYRPTYISLATCTLFPFSAYWLLTVEGPLRMIGMGLLIYYAFGLMVSARAEVQTIATLAAERTAELTRKLQKQNRVIEQASASKSRFLAATSHDMSQPLQAQSFFITAMRRTLDRPDQVELLDKIEGCWRSQQNLLQALVETARLDSGAVIARKCVFDLSVELAALRAEFAGTALEGGIELHISDAPVWVASDPLLVTRILRNLLANALRYTPAGGRVELQWQREGQSVFVEIADTGPGIKAADRERVFEEYVQLGSPAGGTQQGLGLGLTIVSQLARKLDLELRFDTEPGAGTRAGIVLPYRDPQPEKSVETSTMTSLAGSPLVVLVEDEAALREGLTMLLTDWGCRVISAASGAEAMELLSWADAEPALLIIDKRLGEGEDGLDTILALRAEVLDDVPAVLLTGDIYQFERVESIDNITVLAKPADTTQLHAILMEHVSTAASHAPTG
ncbi:hybrid sensor histidine kinase/response regulator [Maricaulis sp.]|uniref:ATP-binding response regulator n=1 Tax=Maricaulis sp. TaxID=1486257 RepID=UPI002B2771D7|nr:ATP-binding protein [Maricaulis sp.]